MGTAVKANGDVDPVGVCSVLTLDKAHRVPSVDQARTRHPVTISCVKQSSVKPSDLSQVITFVQHKCPEDIRDKLEKVGAHFDQPGVASSRATTDCWSALTPFRQARLSRPRVPGF